MRAARRSWTVVGISISATGRARRGGPLSSRARIRNPEHVEDQRQVSAQRVVEQQQPARDLLARGLGRVPLGDPERRPLVLEDRQEWDHLAVRDALTLVDLDLARTAALRELPAQATLPRPGLGDDADHLPMSLQRLFEGGRESRHLRRPPDEAREPARPRAIEPAADGPEPLQGEDADRLADTLQREGPEVAQREVSGHQGRRVLG
jgi:hypothetical protein